MATEMSRHIQELSESAWAITASAFSALLSADVLTHPASLDLRSEFRRFGRGLDGKRVALVPVIGPMFHRPSFFGMDLQSFRERFRVALADEAVSAIVLDVDSPGGQASGVQEAFAEVFRARGTKPVTAVANTMMASGALWLASAADRIIASPSALVGSVGVRWSHIDASGLNQKVGLELTTVTSSAAPHKDEFSPDGALRPEDRRRAQQLADEFHASFVRDLARGRRLSTLKVNTNFGDGRLLTAREALAAGMVDEILSFDAAVARSAGVKPTMGPRVELEWRRLRLAVHAARATGDPRELAGAESRFQDFETQHGGST